MNPKTSPPTVSAGCSRAAAVALLFTGMPVAAQTSSLQDFDVLAPPQSGATTIYVAKEFLTMDPQLSRAEAVAVRGGEFAAVGSLAEVKRAVGSGAALDRRFEGKTVIAGLIEQHVHPVLAALTMSSAVISIEDWDTIDGFSAAVRDEKTYQKRIKAALEHHSENRAEKPFVTWGYHHYFHGKGMDRETLDSLSTEFPIIVWHRSCHEFFLNSAALDAAGIDQEFFNGFSDSQKAQASLETGHFYEQGAIAILGKLAPLMATPEIFQSGLEYTEEFYHRNGITIACEPGGFFSKKMQEAVNAVYSDEDTPFIHYFIADGKSFVAMHPDDPDAMVKQTETVLDWGSGHTRYIPKQVKLLIDGAIFSQLMMMKDGYLDGHEGAWIMDPDTYSYAFQAYWDAGYQIHVHNNGDAGLDVFADNLEIAMKRAPRENHRTVLIHFGFAQPDQVARIAKLGAIVSANPYYVTALAGRYDKVGIGPERAQHMVPLGYVMKNDVSFSFHSDMPMAPAKPLQLAWSAVTRRTFEGTTPGPEHRVPIDLALRAITIDAAYSIQLEDEVGSIEVGKKANLTVLDESPYAVDPIALKDITVVATMLEGRVFPTGSTGNVHTGPGHTSVAGGSTPAGANRWAAMVARHIRPEHGAGCGCSMNQHFARAIYSLDPTRTE